MRVVKDAGGWRLEVNGRPTLIRGVNWDATPVGENYAWSLWERPEDEIRRTLDRDMALMRDAHINAIRAYAPMPARWIRYIYEKYGVFTVLNPIVGRYGLELDGVWHPNTDYGDPAVRAALKAEVRGYVEDAKGTPGLLMWLLGNENNYGLFWTSAEIENLPLAQQEDARAEALYSLFGEIIDEVKASDPHHPVAIANGDLQFIDVIAKQCPHLDVLGGNVYRGRSARDLFDVVKAKLGVPFMFTEFGADAYDAKARREDQVTQASYLRDQWEEIEQNVDGLGRAGNAIGGFVFQWADGWWKYKQDANLDVHDTTASWANAGYAEDFVEGENNMNEEWWGLFARAPTPPDALPPLLPRAAYFLLAEGFRFDPYARGVTAETVRDFWQALDPRAFARVAAADHAVGFDAVTSRVRVSDAILELSTFTTGAQKLLDPARAVTTFQHTESAYLGVEVQPASNAKGRVVVNVLGNVATNPIDEFYFEKRGANTIKLYQGSLEWKERWFDLEGYYRQGHYHWGYEGDFFALYPEANYQPSIDAFNADAPSGVVVSGHQALEGLKLAFGPQLYWGANPTLIGKYDRVLGPFELAVMHQQDVAQLGSAGTSSVLPMPQTAKTTLYGAFTRGGVKLEWGGIMAGYDRFGRAFQNAIPTAGASYLNSGYLVQDDTVRWYDGLGTKAKVTVTGGRVQGYAQAGYRGLVADSQPDQTITLTGWRLKESGQGNHWHALGGLTFNAGPFQVAPNVIYQRPLVAALPALGDRFDAASGTYYPGLRPRNQLQDPFWVRSNREMLAGELLLVFDPTPATWFWQWNNPQKENAPFAASLDFTYKHLPTKMDAGLGVLATGQVFAFPNSAPAQDLWEVWGRFVINAGKVHAAGSLWVGTGQGNGDSTRLITRGGVEARVDVSRLMVNAAVKIQDWGPFDYYRDYNLTFPLQLIGEATWTLDTPRWFFPNQTRIGLSGKFRLLDQYSPRIDPALVVNGVLGQEWEVKSYVRVSL